MSHYGGSSYNLPERSYSHGYGPSNAYVPPPGRSDEKMVGEASSYDLLHDNIESRTLYDAQQQSQPQLGLVDVDKKNDNYNNRITERGFKDFFYKQPDPSYVGMYGTDYEPQVSRSKVAAAAATAAALFYGYSQYRKRKEGNKRFEKYTRPHEGHRNNRSSSTYGHDQPYESRSKY
ncbi:hypothetical protein H4R24_004682 [Coemansia sp. RSA 988]|nr:hypothetical protein H4R24_004682 [Coemansia sp. RSA 988]